MYHRISSACWAPRATFWPIPISSRRRRAPTALPLLNLCLPVYNFIFAIGSMVGLGAATRYAIPQGAGRRALPALFFQCHLLRLCARRAVPAGGHFAPGGLLRLMGGDAGIMALGIPMPVSSLCSRPSSCATISCRPLSATTATPPLPWWLP